MEKNIQYATEKAGLQAQAAEWRLRVVESQLKLAFTLCAIADTEIRYDRPDEALKLVKKLLHHAETIRMHVNEPNHLPRIAIQDLRNRLAELERCIKEIESRLGHG